MALTELGSRLALIIDAKTDGAVSNIQRLTASEKAAAEQADVLRAKIADLEARAAKRPLSNTAGLQLSKAKSQLSGLESSLATVPKGAGRAEQALNKLGLAGEISSSALVSGLATAGAAAAAFAGFEFLKHGIDEFVQLGAQIRQVQQASGADAADSSKLVAITNALGVSSQTAALGVFRLGKNIALQPQNLTNLGIAIAKNKAGQTDLIGTLENVAAAYQATSDPAQKAAIVYEAFGRAGTTLLPILNANRQQLEEIVKAEAKRGHIFSQSDINNAYQYQIATRELKDSLNSLAISAAKSIVPVLTAIEEGATKAFDALHKINSLEANVASKVPGGSTAFRVLHDVTNPFAGFKDVSHLLGLGGDAAAQAQAEIIRQQDQALNASLIQAASGTLDDASIQARPSLRDSKQALAQATQTVKNAKIDQAAALRELAKARGGSPVATESSLTAAEARVTAAELGLRKARYIGGDANIARAQASLASAQNSLNRARAQGGVDTNTLANAEDRLKRANEAVVTAQKKAKAAQKAENEAHGLTAKDLLKQVQQQLHDKKSLAAAQQTLVEKGASGGLIGIIDNINKQTPGSIVKIAHQLSRGLVDKLNADVAATSDFKVLYNNLAGTDSEIQKLGFKRGELYAKSFKNGLTTLIPLPRSITGIASPRTGAQHHSTLGGLLGSRGGVTITGPVTLKADNPHEMGRKLNDIARRRALGSGQ